MLVALEAAAPAWIASRIEGRTSATSLGAVQVDATVSGVPVLTRVLASGAVPRLRLDVTEVAGRRLDRVGVSFDLERVHIDRTTLLDDRVRIDSIDRGELAVVVRGLPASVRRALAIAGLLVDVELTDGSLLLDAPGLDPVQVDVPPGLVTCAPQLEVAGDDVRLTCTIDTLPPLLVEAFSGRR